VDESTVRRDLAAANAAPSIGDDAANAAPAADIPIEAPAATPGAVKAAEKKP
jgi:hypothetical protein